MSVLFSLNKKIFFAGLLYITSVSSILSVQMPSTYISHIRNYTPWNIAFLDRFEENQAVFLLPAYKEGKGEMPVKSDNQLRLIGNLGNVLAQKSQYTIVPFEADTNMSIPNKAVFLNISTKEGGINDGSGIVTGTPGSVVLDFWFAGLQGGSSMMSKRLSGCPSRIELAINVYARQEDIDNDIFRLNFQYELVEV